MAIARVTVIVLNWNGKNDTIECLDSLQLIDYPGLDVIVVDNGSTDESVKLIRDRFPDIFVIETGKNLGYAGGNNIGIEYALQKGAEYILLLNNDTVVDPQLVNAFIEVVHLYPEAGILGAKIYYYTEPSKIWAVGGRWDSDVHELIHVGQGEIDDESTYEDPFEIDYAIGCALFFHRKVVEEIGLLESQFFLNFEENDWCFRARKAGYKIYSVPAAKLWHKISVSFGGEESPLWKYFMTRNKLLWAKRNLSLYERFMIAKKMFLELIPEFSLGKERHYSLLKRFYWEINRFTREIVKRCSHPYYQAQLFGILDYTRGRFGDCPSIIKKRLLAK